MQRTEMRKISDELTSFTDVVYFCEGAEMLVEVQSMLEGHDASYLAADLDHFVDIREKLGLVGTVIIDASALTARQQQHLAGIIDVLEKESIGVVLLTGRLDSSLELPGTAVDGGFTMTTTMPSFSAEELWSRICINLGYRKKREESTAEGVASTGQDKASSKNKLAEQLRMTGVLVDNLVEQLRLAGLVQRDFLPAQLPDSDEIKWSTLFLPAEWVSGDIYDVARIDEQHIGFYLADAVGHAMPAALLTIFVKQALTMRETVGNNYRIFSPAEVMSNLNLRMTSQKLSGYQFVTCCYCLLNIKTLQLTYARAGHPYPLVMRRGEGIIPLEARGSLLGVFEEAEFAQETVQLQRGDKLMLYSDGAEPFIGKFEDEAGFQFTEDFLALKELPVEKLVARFNELVQRHKVPTAEVDDVTAVCLEIL